MKADQRPDPVAVSETAADLGEGPVWDERTGTVVWVDIRACNIHFTNPDDGSTRTVHAPRQVGAIVPRIRGGWVAAADDGFWAMDENDTFKRIASVESDLPQNRMNDGKCDPQGRFWAGTMARDRETNKGSLYRLDADHRVAAVVKDLTISNGLAWSADGRTMYFIDSWTNQIDAFDFDPVAGTLTRRRTVVRLDIDGCLPDGMTIDEQDCLWVAIWRGGEVRRYRPDGRLDTVIPIPTPNVTSCTFGGRDYADLYITTARMGLSGEAAKMQPDAGRLFRVTPGVRGRSPTMYGG